MPNPLVTDRDLAIALTDLTHGNLKFSKLGIQPSVARLEATHHLAMELTTRLYPELEIVAAR
jgi:hypothetical protein